MKMEHWETQSYEIALKKGVVDRQSKVSGIVVYGSIGIHQDSFSGTLILTDIGSGKRFPKAYFDLMLAVEEAQSLATEVWPENEVV